MSVAALDRGRRGSGSGDMSVEHSDSEAENEALMILGVQGTVGKEVEAELREEKGILDVTVVRL